MSLEKEWDHGCELDPVRNDFVIPWLLKCFRQRGPRSILDIGTGTGYVPRKLDAKLGHTIDWVLLDELEERVAFSIAHAPEDMCVEGVVARFIDYETLEKFDAVTILFTLLEMELDVPLFEKLRNIIKSNGYVYLAMPDCLEDVFNAASSDHKVIASFVQNSCCLKKIDKFTGEAYPFIAHRFEFIVYRMMEVGFLLTDFSRASVEGKSVHLLSFKLDL